LESFGQESVVDNDVFRDSILRLKVALEKVNTTNQPDYSRISALKPPLCRAQSV
jgi:hypothetical protein